MRLYNVSYEINGEYARYRLAPAPDSLPGECYKYGAVLQRLEDDEELWRGDFFIEPAALKALGAALTDAASDVDG